MPVQAEKRPGTGSKVDAVFVGIKRNASVDALYLPKFQLRIGFAHALSNGDVYRVDVRGEWG